MSDNKRVLGFIGGSGLYEISGLDNIRAEKIDTPWGSPSDTLTRGQLDGVEIVFLARHGEGHRLTPGAINYRANIDAMKRAGVTDLFSLSACGSFREELAPGTFVIGDQFIDRTLGRDGSFFGPGFVAHVSMADPVCPALGDAAEACCAALAIPHHRGGTYLAMNGPQFSTRAESHLYRQWGCDIVGMTNMPEAKLAREAELPYATIAMVTDYDCWRENDEGVEVSKVLEVMKGNTANAIRLISAIAAHLGSTRNPSPLGIETNLDFAVVTPASARDPALAARLDAVAGRFLSAQ